MEKSGWCYNQLLLEAMVLPAWSYGPGHMLGFFSGEIVTLRVLLDLSWIFTSMFGKDVI